MVERNEPAGAPRSASPRRRTDPRRLRGPGVETMEGGPYQHDCPEQRSEQRRENPMSQSTQETEHKTRIGGSLKPVGWAVMHRGVMYWAVSKRRFARGDWGDATICRLFIRDRRSEEHTS